MKKLLTLIIAAGLLTGCGSDEPKEDPAEATPADTQTNTEELTEEERHAKVKALAEEHSFIQFNGDEVPVDTMVELTGEVDHISEEGMMGEFMLTKKEGDGYGMYSITNMLGTEVSEGDTVAVYGTYNGKNEMGMPSVNSVLVEIK